MKRNHTLRTFICILLCLMMVTPSLADVLMLPSGMKVIDDDAFFGDTSIDEVILPEGIEKIGEKAFAESGIRRVNLPSTLSYIADDAFDKDENIQIDADSGTYAFNWAGKQRFLGPAGSASLDLLYYQDKLIPMNTIIEHDLSEGDFNIDIKTLSIRLMTQLYLNNCLRVHFFAYFLDEAPVFDNPDQINRRDGDFLWDYKWSATTAINKMSQVCDKTTDTGTLAHISAQHLKNHSYVKIHVGLEYKDTMQWYAFGVTGKDDDKLEFRGHKYKLINEKTSWTDAKAECETLGGHLLTINSLLEQNFIVSCLKTYGVQDDYYWIGLTDRDEEGNWSTWITGEAVTYENWAPGEPNDDSNRGQDYAAISTGNNSGNGWSISYGQWDDADELPGSTGLGAMNCYYICEWGVGSQINEDDINVTSVEMSRFAVDATWSGCWPIHEKAYPLSIKWETNRQLEDWMTFRISLCDVNYGRSLVLHDYALRDYELTFSSEKLKNFVSETDELNLVYVRIEILDLVKDEIIYSMDTKNDYFNERSVFYAGGHYTENAEYKIQNAFDVIVLFHDAITLGNYRLGNEWHVGDLTKVSAFPAMIYTLGTGDAVSMDLFDGQKAALIAETVMKRAVTREPSAGVKLSDFKNLLKLAGVELNIIKEVEDAFVENAEDTLCLSFEDYQKALGELHETKSLINAFKGLTTVVELYNLSYSISHDYDAFLSADKEIINQYIVDLNSIGTPVPFLAAQYLQFMTYSPQNLALYLLTAYGSEYACDKLVGTFSTEIISSLLGAQWKIVSAGIKVSGNIFYNASNVFSATYDLIALTDSVQEARIKFASIYDDFISNPPQYYDALIDFKDRFLRLTELEIIRYNEVYKQLNQGISTRVFQFIAGAVFGLDFNNNVNAQDWIEMINDAFDEFYEEYYELYVMPFLS